MIAMESEDRERGRRRTIVQLLRESMEMEGADRLRRRKSLKERLGLMGMSCCGANWGLRSSSAVRDDSDGNDGPQDQSLDSINVAQAPPVQHPGCAPATLGMNLAAALAAERHFRTVQESSSPSPARPNSDNLAEPKALFRVSLMRLLEDTDDQDEKTERRGGGGGGGGGGGVGSDSVCCVCMVRKKGAAFIPCGHTFCRVCSMELWLNRGNCPLCNRSIVEILDIF